MNEDLISQCARDTCARFTWPDKASAGKAEAAACDAIRLYHARAVAPLVEAAEVAHDTLHECTAVLTNNDAQKVAAVMERLRAALKAMEGE